MVVVVVLSGVTDGRPGRGGWTDGWTNSGVADRRTDGQGSKEGTRGKPEDGKSRRRDGENICAQGEGEATRQANVRRIGLGNSVRLGKKQSEEFSKKSCTASDGPKSEVRYTEREREGEGESELGRQAD